MNSLDYIGQKVDVRVDRPLGSAHPKFGFIYPVNYGFIPDTVSGDGEELDAYVLGVSAPVAEFTGECIAVLRRKNEQDDKLIVVPVSVRFSEEEIRRHIHFQEKYFESDIFVKSEKPNKALQHNDPSCHVSCLRTPRASRGRG
jgi:inorganic pyrophosphatase